jgi:hypothetical protein
MNQPRKGPFHLSKQATPHDGLHGLLGDGDKVYGEEIISFYWAMLEQPNESTKEGPLAFELFESAFTSISNSQQGPHLSSLSGMNRQPSKGVFLCNVTDTAWADQSANPARLLLLQLEDDAWFSHITTYFSNSWSSEDTA